MRDPNPLDPSHEYTLIRSESPVTVDGFAQGEIKKCHCDECGAEMYVTRPKTPGIFQLSHCPNCPNTDSN